MGDAEDLLGWGVAVFFLFTLIYLACKGIAEIFNHKTKLSTLKLIVILSQICGLGWFLLWVITYGLVPDGLYGLGISVAGLLYAFVASSLSRS